ncbi:MAG TPA: tetratricopeptide repeat protein [Candidatus Krumholzibacteria bacterium]|nr:tetratricopeptide repeat protein [Candidatus Krumholzibacteria bacterium]
MKEPIIRTHNREIDDLFERYRRAPGSHVFAPLADAYRKLGLVEEALDICARGLSANPRYASGYVVQGKCQYDAGRADRAEESFKKVLEIDAQNLVALRYLGIIRAGCGDSDGARGYFERILTLDPGDKDILQRLDAIRESAPVSANTLVEEIEQVLQPEASKTPTIEIVKERVDVRAEKRVEQPARTAVEARTEDRKVPAEDVIELPEVRDEFEGSPIVLGDDDSVTTEYIATVTLADIFASQGYSEKALKIYHDVLRRQPNNDDVRRKIAAVEKGEPITRPLELETDREHPRPDGIAPVAAPSAIPLPGPNATAPPAGASPVPTTPAGAAIDEGRSYEQFKRWLRTVSD